MSLILKAAQFAEKEHRRANCFRKHSGEPYIVHPARVAGRMAIIPGVTEETVAAAWLHDTLEDCGTSEDALDVRFGYKVLNLVMELTNPSKQFEHLPRWRRKKMDREHIAAASPEAKMIKMADRIDNLKDFWIQSQHDFLRDCYLQESKDLFEVIKDANLGLATELETLLEFLEGELYGSCSRHQREGAGQEQGAV